jgi:two-component system cell cycle sensor histidine kinase/response regulator CckA
MPHASPRRDRRDPALTADLPLLDAIPDAVCLVHLTDRVIRYANAAVREALGYEPDEIVGQSTAMLYADAETFEAFGRAARAAFGHGARYRGEWPLRAKNGDVLWFDITSTPAGSGETAVAVSVLHDVSRRRAAEAARRESDRTLATLMDNLPGMVYRCRHDRDRTMELVTEGARALTGYPPEVLLAGGPVSYAGLIHPDDREMAWASVQAAVAEHRPFRLTYRLTARDGEERWVWEQGAGVFAPDGRLVALEGLVLDVTERRRLGDRVRQAQKLEAIGQLAGGVAHDFNNLLTAILGYGELLLESLPEGDPRRADVLEIRQAGQSAAALTQQLLAFSRRQILAPTVLDLNEIVIRVQKMLGRVIGEDVRLVARLGPDLPRVKADAGQIEQILMDLAVNARDAMPTGGTLTIETRAATLDAATADRVGAPAGDGVQLTVRDTGTGMDERTRTRVFEPFFTTKEQGRGTGLGLATVYGIVKQSGGAIWVESEEGRGAAFTIHLPLAGEEEPGTADRAPAPSHGRRETLVLVEDDASVRGFAATVLRRHGYEVVEAENGPHAVELVSGRDAPFDLLVTDVVMPDMSGRQLVERLTARGFSFRTLFMSGYTSNAIVHHGVLEDGLDFLPKPFSVEILVRKVRSALDR